MLCSEAVLVNQGADEGHATILRCKRWSCDLCNPYNHRRIKRAAREGAPNTFLTLTVKATIFDTPDEAARALKRAWVNLRRALERERGVKAPPFIAVFEATKRGWPHLHIMMRAPFVPQKWYSDTMDRLLQSPVVDVSFIDSVGRVAAYVAKYISKAPEGFLGCKRWWRSHDYEVDKEEHEPFRRFGAHVSEIRETLESYAKQCLRRGYVIVEERHDYIRWQWWTKAGAPSPWATGGGP